MTTATKAIAGIGGLLAITVVPSTYLAIASSSSNEEETNKRPTGETWLLNSDYSFDKPTFRTQNHLSHGCSENLFSNNKEESDPTKDSKLYGCAVMNMDLWNTGSQFWESLNPNNKIDPKWIQFNSEIAIRKGNEGWVINARVDNLNNDSQNSLGYMLTTYKYENRAWKKNKDLKLWMDPTTMDGTPKGISDGNGEEMQIHEKAIVIKIPGATWFNNSNWISQSGESVEKIKKSSETKSWSGAWIDDNREESSSWIFQDIELYVGEKKYSQVFCKGEENDCFQSSAGSSGGLIKEPTKSDTWSNATQGSYNNQKVKEVIPKTVKEIINKLKNSKGFWKKLEDICGVNGDPSEEQKNQLRMYCSNGKKSS